MPKKNSEQKRNGLYLCEIFYMTSDTKKMSENVKEQVVKSRLACSRETMKALIEAVRRVDDAKNTNGFRRCFAIFCIKKDLITGIVEVVPTLAKVSQSYAGTLR